MHPIAGTPSTPEIFQMIVLDIPVSVALATASINLYSPLGIGC